MSEKKTPEEIKQYYKAAMDSVNLINKGKQEDMTDEEWADILDRNKRHLEIVVDKDFWTDEDLTPFHDAIAAASQ
jgi:hypothetical protein